MKEKQDIDRNQVILVDKNDNAIGTASKEEAHRQPLLHRAFSVFLYHDDKMLIQKRAFHKYHSGGLWANTCCSHPGDNMWITENARERLMEETGISCDIREIFTFIYEHKFSDDLYEHEYDHVLIGEYRGDFDLNPDEVEEMKWISFEELKKELVRNPKTFAPWFVIAAPRVLEHLEGNK